MALRSMYMLEVTNQKKRKIIERLQLPDGQWHRISLTGSSVTAIYSPLTTSSPSARSPRALHLRPQCLCQPGGQHRLHTSGQWYALHRGWGGGWGGVCPCAFFFTRVHLCLRLGESLCMCICLCLCLSVSLSLPLSLSLSVSLCVSVSIKRERERDRQTDRFRDRETQKDGDRDSGKTEREREFVKEYVCVCVAVVNNTGNTHLVYLL